MNIFQTLTSYFEYPFARYALAAGALISLCAALLGVTLVLKRYSMIGDGLSHAAFGAFAIAAVFSAAPMAAALPITAAAAVILLGVNAGSKIKGDAAVAMISVGALAVGYFLLNVYSSSSNFSGDVCSTLFGSSSILTLSKTDVILCLVLTLAVVVVYSLFYHKIFAVAFDEAFAAATGINVGLYNAFIAVAAAIVIVLALKLVGALLISALIVFPAVSAMRLFKSFRSTVICSACLSIFCSVFGIIIAILYETPVGSTIVLANIAVFFLCFAAGKITGRS